MSSPIERKRLEVELGQLSQNLLANELRALQLEEDVANNTKAGDSIRAAIGEKQAEIAALDAPVAEGV